MDAISQLLESTAALLTALAAVFTGIISFAKAFGADRKVKRLLARERAQVALKKEERPMRWSVVVGSLSILAAVSIFTGRHVIAQNKPLNARLTSEAFDAFNAKKWKQAIAKADECITEFQAQADRQQAQLEKERAPMPPTGEVSEAQKKEIHRRGLLNDIATCFWIKSRSLLEMGQVVEAKLSLQTTAKYTYARCWDPNGWFWSPAEDASDRLKKLP